MEQLNCIIIEDQIPAQETLKGYIKQVPTLNLLDAYISPLEAMESLNSSTVDLLFLDVHLPKLSGIELLKTLQKPPQTILTTAFSEYAIDGFELDVVDYLLKPFSFNRFLKSISKVEKKGLKNKSWFNHDFLFVRNKGQLKKVAISEIQYIEARGDFSIIYTMGNREIANISLQKILSLLGCEFVRAHKSYIVNIDKIEKIIGNHILIKTKQIPIGRTFKEQFMQRIKTI